MHILSSGYIYGMGREVGSQLRQEHLNRWKTSEGSHQSKILMSKLLPSKIKELQSLSGRKLKAAVRLLTGHTTLEL
jgi:hypothetical protein